MTLIEVLRLLRKSWKLIVATTVVAVLAAAAFTAVQPVRYEASSTGYLLVGEAQDTLDPRSGNTIAAERVTQYMPLIGTKAVAEEMAKVLADGGKKTTASPFKARILPASNIMEVTADGETPNEAQDRANAGLQAMANIIFKMESINPSAQQANEAGDLDSLPTGGQPSVALVNFEPAELPSTLSSPNWKRNLLFGFAAGLALGIALALGRKYVDTRVRTQQQVEKLTGASVLGVIPFTAELKKQRGKGEVSSATGLADEPLRKLRTNLRFASLDNPARVVVVTSPNPSEGKSTVTANLARVLAQSGQPVVVVDADLRKPMQAKVFQVDSKVGLTQVLTGDVPLNQALQPTGTPNLQVLTSGRIPPNPSEVVGSQHMAKLLATLSEQYMVLVDAPPVLPVTDAGLLTAVSDGALLVVRLGKTYKDQVELAVNNLERVNGHVLGAVLNGATRKTMGEALYGYGKGYGYASEYYYSYEDGPKVRKKRGKGGQSSTEKETPTSDTPVQLKPFDPNELERPAVPARGEAPRRGE